MFKGLGLGFGLIVKPLRFRGFGAHARRGLLRV